MILAEEWHTADALIRLSDQLHEVRLRPRCVLFWNANNTMSFHRVDWPRLSFVAQITTVSRYMKHLMWKMGLNPLVIPNGIPARLLQPVDPGMIDSLRRVLRADSDTMILFKAGRFDPAERWLMAVEAAAQFKARGLKVVFPLRGGIEEHGEEVLAHAVALGLSVTDVHGDPQTWDDVLALLSEAPRAEVYNLRFFLPQTYLRPFYATADAVLAASGHEPFGLMGLEAMAAGGLVCESDPTDWTPASRELHLGPGHRQSPRHSEFRGSVYRRASQPHLPPPASPRSLRRGLRWFRRIGSHPLRTWLGSFGRLPSMVTEARDWNPAVYTLSNDEKLMARHILGVGEVPAPDEIRTALDLERETVETGLRMLARLGFLTGTAGGYRLASGHERFLAGLGFNFHTVTLENGERFNVP